LLAVVAFRPASVGSTDGLHWLGMVVFLATAVVQLILYKTFF
jgi:hypothetical protein